MPDGKEFRVNIWDFGGQEIYHETHQFFLTKRSLYTLVADSAKKTPTSTTGSTFVELLSANSPLLIIKNEKQERQREINDRQLRGEFTNLKETLATNFATNRGLPEILTQVKHYISNLPHVGTELPKPGSESEKRWSKKPALTSPWTNTCNSAKPTASPAKQTNSNSVATCTIWAYASTSRKTICCSEPSSSNPPGGTDAVYKVLDNSRVIQNLGKFTRAD
jgi:hypothetical protein